MSTIVYLVKATGYSVGSKSARVDTFFVLHLNFLIAIITGNRINVEAKSKLH